MPRIRSTHPTPAGRVLTSGEQCAELRDDLQREPTHMLTEKAITRRRIAECKTRAKASSLITEYERKYGPGCVMRGLLPGGKVRVVCLNPEVAAAHLRTHATRASRTSSQATRASGDRAADADT